MFTAREVETVVTAVVEVFFCDVCGDDILTCSLRGNEYVDELREKGVTGSRITTVKGRSYTEHMHLCENCTSGLHQHLHAQASQRMTV